MIYTPSTRTYYTMPPPTISHLTVPAKSVTLSTSRAIAIFLRAGTTSILIEEDRP